MYLRRIVEKYHKKMWWQLDEFVKKNISKEVKVRRKYNHADIQS